jgi:hypothetical protein
MERKRRMYLRDVFTKLRKLVPTVSDNKRAAKVRILRAAVTYVEHLNKVESDLSRLNAELCGRQKELSTRLRQLRVESAKLRGSVENSSSKKRIGSR